MIASLCLWITNDAIRIVFQNRSVWREDQFEMQWVWNEVADWNGCHRFCYSFFLLHDSQSVSPAKLQEDNVIPRIPLCLHLLMPGPPVSSVCFRLTMICKAFSICKAWALDYSERRKQGEGRPNVYLEKVKNIPGAQFFPPKISSGHSFSSRSWRNV